MKWFLFALAATLAWGFADLFYKKGTDEGDTFSHLKTGIWVGIVMGVCSFALILFSGEKMSVRELAYDMLRYSPASVSYIVSMVIGYAGLRYLEVSIISPVQNASGAFSAIAMIVFFTVTGKTENIFDEFSVLDITGTAIIAAGVIMLAVVERGAAKTEKPEENGLKKYETGALALIFPLLYCLFDTVGTAADGIILDGETGLGLSEIQVLILYGLTFFVFGLCAWVYLLIRTKRAYNPFSRGEIPKGTAALCEESGQVFYVYAMAASPVLAAPMIASYCIVSVILSRLILREKLTKPQYACVITVILGIVLLGISEGMA